MLPTSRQKMASTTSIGQIPSSSIATSKLEKERTKDKKLFQSTIDGNDSELETITVPMLDSSPGGKKSFRFEKEENCCDNVDTVDHVQLEKTYSDAINGSDCVKRNKEVPSVLSKPLPTPGVKITLPSPSEGSAELAPYLNESSLREVKQHQPSLPTHDEQPLSNTTSSHPTSTSSSSETQTVSKRQPPPLPPRGGIAHKSVENNASSSSKIKLATTLPVNSTINTGTTTIPRLSAESAGSVGGMAGSLTPRRLSAAATSLSEGKNSFFLNPYELL